MDKKQHTAHSLMRKEEQKRQESFRSTKVKEAKIKAMATARQLWECQKKSFETSQGTSVSSVASAVPIHVLSSRYSRSFSKEEEDMFRACRKIIRPLSDFEIVHTDLTFFAELELENLQLYGTGAVAAAISHRWPPQTALQINTISFHFIKFDDIVYLLGKLKTQFPNIKAASFECASIEIFSQLNALGEIQGLKDLTIETEGNPILQLSMWRIYTVYVLRPTIEQINGSKVTELERNKAEQIFAGLGYAPSLLLPKYRLSSLLNSPRVKERLLRVYSPNSLQRPSISQIATEVMKATFTYNPDFEFSLHEDELLATQIMNANCRSVQNIIKKRIKFNRIWPHLYLEMICSALEECNM